MIEHWRQARNLFFFALLLLCLNGPSFAKPALVSNGSEIEPNGFAGAGGNKVLSVEEVFGGLGSALGKFIPTWGDGSDEVDDPAASAIVKVPLEDKSSSAEVQKAQKQDESTLIKAKRLDDPSAGSTTSQKKAEDAAAPPYKVYAAPMIPEEADEQDSPRAEPYRASRVAAPVRASGDTKAPPELTDEYMRDNLDDIIVNPPLRGENAPREESERRENVPTVDSLPKQFFPIFPFAAMQDAQAQLLPVASNRGLDEDQGDIERAIIVVHDIQRNSVEGVATLMTLAGSNDAPTLILAPQFPLDIDIARFAKHLPERGQRVSRWTLDDAWQYGGESVLAPRQRGISSFTAMDILLLYLSDHQRFPSLRQIVIVGHGVGADFVQRYAALGQAPDILAKEKIPVRFVAANASSYLYLTHVRPSDMGRRFVSPDMKACPKMNDYPYGIQNLPAYAKRTGGNAIRMRYPARNVMYLVGEKITTDNFLNRSCEANVQGPTRTARTQNYGAFISQSFGEDADRFHRSFTISGAGYDPVAIYGSPCGMEALFGDGVCK